ncbi:MAG TPA: HAD family hydrolase [Candidatus Binatia bacterium]|nr:HAD family hydrolase [Candidatus Binatia bacterium]
MKLVVFDIDGTLTLGDGLGTRCFFDAFQDIFGPCQIDCRLTAYRESTDAGIALEALAMVWGRPATLEHIESFKQAYLTLLENEVTRREQAYRPMPGSRTALIRLARDHGWTVGLATGNWQKAASIKLASAGIEVGDAVGAYSEDGHTRAEVLAAAIARAAQSARRCASQPEAAPATRFTLQSATPAAGRYAKTSASQSGVGAAAPAARFERVIYVGDQPWDKQAADLVGVPFLGIGSEERGGRLASCGARVLEDYERFDLFVDALEECAAAGRKDAPIC